MKTASEYNYGDMKQKQSIGMRRKNILLKKQTAAEIVFALKLAQIGIRYMPQKLFFIGKNMAIVDFYLPKPYRIAIEIDGGYHNNPEQIKRDENRTRYLNSRKVKVIRFTNEEAYKITTQEIQKVIHISN